MIRSVKFVERLFRQPWMPPRRCELCGDATREGKPYCPEHVERHPYVQEVLAVLEERSAEERRVLRRGASAVDPRGVNAREILLQLHLYGERTVERLARDLQLDPALVPHYAQALARRGLVSLGRTERGSVLVCPVAASGTELARPLQGPTTAALRRA